MATKKSTADDWNKALSTWTKKPAVTTTKKDKKKTTTVSTSDRVRDTQLGKTQTVATRPVSTSDRLRSGTTPVTQGPLTRREAERKKKRSQPADPLSEALNTWRSKVVEPTQRPPDRVQYDVPERTFDYGVDRVDTRPGAFTGQQQQSPTRTTTVQPYDPNTAQGPQERPTGINAWLPKNFAFNAPVGALAAANMLTDPKKREAAGNLIGAGFGAIRDELANSAAGERFQLGIDQNRQAYEQGSTWGDVGQGLVDFGTNLAGDIYGMGRSLAEMSVGAKTGQEVATGAIENMNLAPYARPIGNLMDLNQYTGRIKQGAMNVLAGAQFAQDYANTGFDVGNDLPLGPNIASGWRTLGEKLFPGQLDTEYERITPELIQRKATEWYKTFQKYTTAYRDAVQPDAMQQGLQQGPETRAMNRERSFLNWADPVSVANTYDALTNQQTTVNELNQKANQAWQEGALSTSEAARDELWRQAADAGAKAYQLQNTHPQELVNQNTNIVAQLLMEIAQPDITDILGGVFSLAGATPAARRLTRVADEVATPTEKVIRALDDMVVTADNAAQVAAQRSGYSARNLLSPSSWWSTGRARANMATDNMLRYTVNLLSDVETPRDAAFLLNQLATDPRKLVTGIPAAGLQSPGLLARAGEDGLVRFGGMNIQRIKEPLRIFQQAAQNILTSPVLKEGAILNKVDFVTTFMDEMNEAGYRFYNVAVEGADIPTGATSGRIVGAGSRQYIVEYLDASKKVISKSEPVTMAEANKLKKAAASTTRAQKSFLGEVGALQRSIVSPFYILSSPGTWATNIIGGLATAVGDGNFALRSGKYIDEWIGKQFGVDPTARGIASVESAGSSASQVKSKGIFKFLEPLRKTYGQIDEQVGKRVYYASASKAMRQVGKKTLTQTLTPLLQAAGVAEKDARRIITHLYEAGLQGGDLTSEFNKLLNGQTKVLALSEINPTWLDAIPPDRIEALNNIIRTATSRDEALAAIKQWGQDAGSHWDELIASSQSALPRYVWMKQEVLQDTADITQAGRMATKYGDVPAEVAQATTKQLADEMTATQERMATLAQIVNESNDPKNRYILYNIWGQRNDLDAGVRHQLLEMADAANGLTGAAKQQAWQQYWQETQRLWTDRNARVNQLLEEGSAALGNGQNFVPRWDILERTASQNEARLWETMKLEPGSGRYDTRLKQVIDAGRAISDRAVARTYAAAIRFLNVDAMDFIVSAEHNVQMAGAAANNYLDKARQVALKANNDAEWDKFFRLRNEVRRQQRVYERAAWEQATRHITEEGVKLEAAAPAVTAVDDLTQAADEAGSYYKAPTRIASTPEVPTMDKATAAKADAYLAQNAAENPYPPEAVAALEEAGATADVFDASMERLAAADVGFPGSKALDEAQGLRAERAAATASGGMETRAQNYDMGQQRLQRKIDQPTQAASASPFGSLPASEVAPGIYKMGKLPKVPVAQEIARLRATKATDAMDATFNRLMLKDFEEAQRRGITEYSPPLPIPPKGWQKATSNNTVFWYDKARYKTASAFSAALKADEAVPQRVVRQGGNDLNALRKAARDAGIPTLTDAGRPMDKRLVNTINKDLGLKLRGLRDLTPGQYQAAMEALARRATPAPAAAPIVEQVARYTPPAEQVALVEQTLQPGLERVAKRFGTTVDELVTAGNQALKPLTQSPVAIQVATGNIDSILDSGELQNAFRTRKTSPGKATSLDYRASAEAKGLGIPRTAAPEEHAVYGYLLVDDYARKLVSTPQFDMGYGDISFVLKDDVRARTTFTVGDSVNQFDGNRAVGIPLDGEPSVTAWGGESPAVWGYAQNGDIREFLDQVAYVETHTQGGVKISDVRQVLDPNSKLSPAQIQRLEAQGIQVLQGTEASVANLGKAAPGPEMRTYDFTVQALDPEKVAKALNFGGWWGKKNIAKEQADILRRTTEAGGATAGELAHGAAFAKQQLENILTYMENNIDEIIKPGQRMIGQGQNLRALEEFKKTVIPAWDNVKYAASEYGNRMRSFTMVDFANQTRMDEIMGLYMPYGFWMTRTAKNSLERAIFQPHIWRRVMQAEREIRAIQEQQDAPERYEGAFPIMSADGVQPWLRFLPSKYWPAAGIFTSNDYADPESANSAFEYATESMRAANLASYPWWDAATKALTGKANEIYPVNYLPQGRIIADLALKYMGTDAAVSRLVLPGYFENSVARTLNNMAVKGEITREQARWAHDYLWQLKQGGEELPEEMTGAYDPTAIEAILDKAVRSTAGMDLQAALTSFATGMSVRPYDTAEQQWSGAAENYRNYKYGEQNPYGSKAAADTQKPDAALSWSKSGVWRPEDGRPGVSMATDAKSAEKEALNAELMAATDEFISGFNGTPSNKQLNEFKDKWVADRTGVQGEYFGDTINQYLDEKYPSATTFTPAGGERYPGYAPEEIRIKVRTAAYYKAKEELPAPVYPGADAGKAAYDKYFSDKAAYDKAIVARVAELINDPVAMRQLAGLPVTNAPTSISDYLRSNSADTFNLNNALGYPMRPTGTGAFDAGMTDLAGDPENAEAIIEAEKTKYMSELEKQVRAANAEKGGSGGRGGRSYRGRGYSRRSGGRGYSRRRYYGGGGGGAGGNYYVPQVEGRGLSEWLDVDPERIAYRAPNQVRVNPPDIGPEAIRAWKKLSW
jgi:hypothetical protein